MEFESDMTGLLDRRAGLKRVLKAYVIFARHVRNTQNQFSVAT
jgi:hypothetical protein